MKKSILFISLLLIYRDTWCQSKPSKYNFDFDKIENGLPSTWSSGGQTGYSFTLDSINKKNGKYSVAIEQKDPKSAFGTLSIRIPENFEGKKIKISGFIKTQNVVGSATLWMRIDPGVAFDNMNDRPVTGTTDWKKYEIELNMNPSKTKEIFAGGLLVGKGKMWLDDVEITVDGVSINELNPIPKKIYPAELDKEFDTRSKILKIAVDKNKIDALQLLGLVWGFLKYYHPSVASGSYHWDYELFRIMPKVLKEMNTLKSQDLLAEWVEQLGKLEPSLPISSEPKGVKLKPDLGWITKQVISKKLTDALIRVKEAKRSDDHYYIGLAEYVKNPEIKNENPYSTMKFPDMGYRLLSLYRYWNIIQYYFPYKNLIKEDWQKVLTEFVPKFINATDETAYIHVCLELIARVHDTHANIWGNNEPLNKIRGINYAAAELSFIEGKAVVTGFHDTILGKQTGLQPGDVIVKINHKPIESIIREKLKWTPASNYPTQLRDIASDLLRTNDSIVIIEYINQGRQKKKQINTYPAARIHIKNNFQKKDTCFRIINPQIGYIYPGSIKNIYLPEIWKQIEKTSGLIIDLRCYPSEFIVFSLGEYLMPRSTNFVKFSNGNITSPGLFTMTDTLQVGGPNPDFYKGKVVILVNEITQSQAEYTTMAFRTAPKAIVIGSTTAGADGNVSQFYLPGGIYTMISGLGVYYPDGRETQRIGIVPDIVVKPTIEGIRKGRDELLEKAVDLIKNH